MERFKNKHQFISHVFFFPPFLIYAALIFCKAVHSL